MSFINQSYKIFLNKIGLIVNFFSRKFSIFAHSTNDKRWIIFTFDIDCNYNLIDDAQVWPKDILQNHFVISNIWYFLFGNRLPED